MTTPARLEELRAEVSYLRTGLPSTARRSTGRGPPSPRLEKLEREYELAESRLRRAEQESDEP